MNAMFIIISPIKEGIRSRIDVPLRKSDRLITINQRAGKIMVK